MQLSNTRLNDVIEKLQDQLVPYLKSQNVQFTSTGKFTCINPAHDDSTPSSSVVPNSLDRVAHCFGCSLSYSIFGAANFLEGMPQAGPAWVSTTIKTLCERFNIDMPDIVLSKEDQELLEIYSAYEDAARIIKCSTVDKYVDEFESRGWSADIGQRYGIGFVESYLDFSDKLKAGGHSPHILEKAGLNGPNAKQMFHSGNMIFTIFDHTGTPVAFTARNSEYEKDKSVSKYINSAGSAIYRKREILYGLNFSKNLAVKKGLILVEGNPDWVTMQEKGIRNVAAICGTSLTKEHVILLTNLGISRIIIALDNDTGGQLGLKHILDEVIADLPQLQADIIMLPKDQDPDDYLCELEPKAAIEAWNKLEVMSCFKWRLQNFDVSIPMDEVATKMIPLIITEPNLISRERMAKELSDHTGIRLSAIQNQMDKITRMEEFKESERVRSIVNSTMKDMSRNPGAAAEIMQQAVNTISDLKKASSIETLGVDETSKAFKAVVDKWKTHTGDILGIKTGFAELDEAINGLQEGRAVGIGGKPNHGKSAFVSTLAYNVVKLNADCIVIMHTTDDSFETLTSRLVAIDQDMRINWITSPKHNLRLPGTAPEANQYNTTYTKKWAAGTKNIQDMIDSGRLVIKDSTQGTTLAYTESLIKYYKENNPTKRILVIFDNFHKAGDFPELDERIRYKRMSHQIKFLSEKYHVALIATMEYTKMDEGVPTDFNLAESVQMSYDLSVIMHVYNQLKDLGLERAKLCYNKGVEGSEPIPVVQVKVTKNKQSSFDGSLYYSFFTDKGKFEEYSRLKAQQEFFQKEDRFGRLGESKKY